MKLRVATENNPGNDPYTILKLVGLRPEQIPLLEDFCRNLLGEGEFKASGPNDRLYVPATPGSQMTGSPQLARLMSCRRDEEKAGYVAEVRIPHSFSPLRSLFFPVRGPGQYKDEKQKAVVPVVKVIGALYKALGL
jgi:hypothetical protein